MKQSFKAFIISFVAVAGFGFALTGVAQTSATDLAQAEKYYADRDYTPAGIQSAQMAADLYQTLAGASVDKTEKAKLQTAMATALYFVGSASSENAVKLQKHDLGYKTADAAMQALGVASVTAITDAEINQLKSSLSPADMDLLANAIYQRGTNLGQWGQAQGVFASLGRWPELRSTMELVIKLGKESLHQFGPRRTLGRAYYKLPGFAGGSLKKSEENLSIAMKGSLAPGQIFSINGYNNLYFAELLKDQSRETDAKDILTGFISADPLTLRPDSIVETKRAQAEAQELLNSF
jgi:hypothetical protein